MSVDPLCTVSHCHDNNTTIIQVCLTSWLIITHLSGIKILKSSLRLSEDRNTLCNVDEWQKYVIYK